MIELLKKFWCFIFHYEHHKYKMQDCLVLIYCKKCGKWWREIVGHG